MAPFGVPMGYVNHQCFEKRGGGGSRDVGNDFLRSVYTQMGSLEVQVFFLEKFEQSNVETKTVIQAGGWRGGWYNPSSTTVYNENRHSHHLLKVCHLNHLTQAEYQSYSRALPKTAFASS